MQRAHLFRGKLQGSLRGLVDGFSIPPKLKRLRTGSVGPWRQPPVRECMLAIAWAKAGFPSSAPHRYLPTPALLTRIRPTPVTLRMSQISPSDKPRSDSSLPDDLLPPVEPPSAGFIVKLFLVPAIIVCLVVFVVFAFNWLVHLGSNPQAYLDDMERGAANSWQRAHDFVQELRGRPELRKDEKVAARVAKLLDGRLARELGTGDQKATADEVQYRVFLCKALGEFEVPTGMPILMRVAETPSGGNDNQLVIRLAAVESLALLIDNVRKSNPDFADPKLLDLLLEISSRQSEPDGKVRSRAAFALGIYGGDQAVKRLEEMTDAFREPYADARFNAAIGLARLGNTAGVPILLDMLDPEQQAGVESEDDENTKAYKRHLIQVNGLRAVELLIQSKASFDRSELKKAVQHLRDAPGLPTGVKLKSQEVLNMLEA